MIKKISALLVIQLAMAAIIWDGTGLAQSQAQQSRRTIRSGTVPTGSIVRRGNSRSVVNNVRQMLTEGVVKAPINDLRLSCPFRFRSCLNTCSGGQWSGTNVSDASLATMCEGLLNPSRVTPDVTLPDGFSSYSTSNTICCARDLLCDVGHCLTENNAQFRNITTELSCPSAPDSCISTTEWFPWVIQAAQQCPVVLSFIDDDQVQLGQILEQATGRTSVLDIPFNVLSCTTSCLIQDYWADLCTWTFKPGTVETILNFIEKSKSGK